MKIVKFYLSGTILGTIFGSIGFASCCLLPYLVAVFLLHLNVNHSQIVITSVFYSIFGTVGFGAFCLPSFGNCKTFLNGKLNLDVDFALINERLMELCGLLTGFTLVLQSFNLLFTLA